MKIDYKKAYEDLKDYLINLEVHCGNCCFLIDDYNHNCEDCNRNDVNWRLDENCLKPLSEYEIKE